MANFGERYELIRRIGAGGMGEVWLAHDEELAGRPVAIKIMHKHMLPNSGDVARFEREARIAASMDHPNIVTVYTTGAYQGAPFMVMEYLSGQDMERAMPGGGAERAAAIGRDICGALAYAHGKGVIHATPTARATASGRASTAQALVRVPDVVGMPFTRARLVLIGDGFKVTGGHTRLGQTVTSTSPSGRAAAAA